MIMAYILSVVLAQRVGVTPTVRAGMRHAIARADAVRRITTSPRIFVIDACHRCRQRRFKLGNEPI